MPLRSVSKIMRISYFRGHVLLVSVWSVSCVYVTSRLRVSIHLLLCSVSCVLFVFSSSTSPSDIDIITGRNVTESN